MWGWIEKGIYYKIEAISKTSLRAIVKCNLNIDCGDGH